MTLWFDRRPPPSARRRRRRDHDGGAAPPDPGADRGERPRQQRRAGAALQHLRRHDPLGPARARGQRRAAAHARRRGVASRGRRGAAGDPRRPSPRAEGADRAGGRRADPRWRHRAAGLGLDHARAGQAARVEAVGARQRHHQRAQRGDVAGPFAPRAPGDAGRRAAAELVHAVGAAGRGRRWPPCRPTACSWASTASTPNAG